MKLEGIHGFFLNCKISIKAPFSFTDFARSRNCICGFRFKKV